MSAAYRFRQGLRALVSWMQPVEDAVAAQYLSPPLFTLYSRMRRAERQHSLRVLRDLRAAGHTHPDLLAAALLHDVGKVRTRFFLPEKVLVVLIKAFSPPLYRRWGSESDRGWRRPFAVSVQHPAWGADMVAEAGGSALTVELIRRHADPAPNPPATDADHLLAALQAVDDQN
jgi:hypothetical protein